MSIEQLQDEIEKISIRIEPFLELNTYEAYQFNHYYHYFQYILNDFSKTLHAQKISQLDCKASEILGLQNDTKISSVIIPGLPSFMTYEEYLYSLFFVHFNISSQTPLHYDEQNQFCVNVVHHLSQLEKNNISFTRHFNDLVQDWEHQTIENSWSPNIEQYRQYTFADVSDSLYFIRNAKTNAKYLHACYNKLQISSLIKTKVINRAMKDIFKAYEKEVKFLQIDIKKMLIKLKQYNQDVCYES